MYVREMKGAVCLGQTRHAGYRVGRPWPSGPEPSMLSLGFQPLPCGCRKVLETFELRGKNYHKKCFRKLHWYISIGERLIGHNVSLLVLFLSSPHLSLLCFFLCPNLDQFSGIFPRVAFDSYRLQSSNTVNSKYFTYQQLLQFGPWLVCQTAEVFTFSKRGVLLPEL